MALVVQYPTCWLGLSPRLFGRVLMICAGSEKAIGVAGPDFFSLAQNIFAFENHRYNSF